MTAWASGAWASGAWAKGTWAGIEDRRSATSSYWYRPPDDRFKRVTVRTPRSREEPRIYLESPHVAPRVFKMRPFMDVNAELKRFKEEAAKAKRKRLRAQALAEDEWLILF